MVLIQIRAALRAIYLLTFILGVIVASSAAEPPATQGSAAPGGQDGDTPKVSGDTAPAPKKETGETPPAANKPEFSIPEVVVTATRVETPVEDIPADVAVIGPSRLQRPGTDNFQQALTDVPGARINSRQDNDMVTMGVEVRGLETNPTSGTNVLVLLDGIPQRRMSFGGPYVGGLPSYALDRMELVKGPMGSLYGRGALAGALQLFSDPGTKTLQFDLQDTYEDTVRSSTTAFHMSGPLPRLADATFSFTAMGDVFAGWQPRTDGNRENLYLHSRMPLSNCDTLDVVAGFFQGKENMAGPVPIDANGRRLPGIDRDDNLTVPNHNSSNVTKWRAGAIWQHDLAEDLRTKLTLAYWDGTTKWHDGLVDDGPPPGSTILPRIGDDDQ